MTGKDKAKAVADNLRKEQEEREEKEQEAKNELVEFQGNQVTPAVADFFRQNANVGSDNLGGSMPQLKITEALSKNELENGERANPGEFYYSPTKEAFKELEVVIMSISRGFYAMDNSDDPKPKFNQLVSGMIVDSMQPFVMFATGSRLNNLWKFGKEIRPFTKNKQYPIPMFTIIVKLTTEKTENDKGQEFHVVNYELVKEDGKIKIISDLEFLSMIRSGVDSAEDMMESFIESKEVNKKTGQLIREQGQEVTADNIPYDDKDMDF